jgi:hydrogenase maturation protein HypF
VIKRLRLHIDGIVQGVGFRPHIYRLANKYQLGGYVINTSKGVEIEIEGSEEKITSFMQELNEGHLPPLSKVLSCTTTEQEPKGYRDFRIYESIREEGVITLLSPDITVCHECLQELNNPEDRRYQYPFINCTNCGPRYTITESLPYDRANTVMSEFVMCEQCEKEYHDPSDRRFHAQPNACFACGPQVFLVNSDGKEIARKQALEKTIQFLQQGYIIAIKGLGGFHLAADASNERTITMLREHKGREEKPLALMVSSIETAEQFCTITEIEKHFLLSPQRPIVLVEKKKSTGIAENVAPGNKYLGIFLPYTPLHQILMSGSFPALVMTSANISEEPLCADNEEALNRLHGIADYFLMHNRRIHQRCDDSVIAHAGTLTVILRRSRGFAPEPVILPVTIPDSLAVGGHLKNTICLGKNNRAFLSQHIGDLETYETYQFFQETVKHLVTIFEAEPGIIIHDLHPGYLSTKWAIEQKLPLFGIQHHEAHVASCMAEHHIVDPVIGVALDGTGYGTDGKIWGSEFFVGNPGNFKRCAHFDYIEMAGGDVAAKEPWRMAVAYLHKYCGNDWLHQPLPFHESIESRNIAKLIAMIDNNINCFETCGCGRLFDAVSSLLGVRQNNKYEGQAPMELEMLIEPDDSSNENDWQFYPYHMQENPDMLVVSWASLFYAIREDLNQHVSNATIAKKFHHTVVQVVMDICNRLRNLYAIHNVILSGGCFQNRYLLKATVRLLQKQQFKVFCHQQVPPNDGGISLGQLYIYALQSQ